MVWTSKCRIAQIEAIETIVVVNDHAPGRIHDAGETTRAIDRTDVKNTRIDPHIESDRGPAIEIEVWRTVMVVRLKEMIIMMSQQYKHLIHRLHRATIDQADINKNLFFFYFLIKISFTSHNFFEIELNEPEKDLNKKNIKNYKIKMK